MKEDKIEQLAFLIREFDEKENKVYDDYVHFMMKSAQVFDELGGCAIEKAIKMGLE